MSKNILLKALGVLVIVASALLFIVNLKQMVNRTDKIKETIRIRITNAYESFQLQHYPMLYEALSEIYDKVIITKDGEKYDLIINTAFRNKKLDDNKTPKIFITSEVVWPNQADSKKWEIVKVTPDKYDLSIGYDYLDHPKYMRIPLYYIFYTNKISTNFKRGNCNPNKKYFACFMVSNEGWNQFNDGCKLRNRIFHKLSLYKKVESGGKYLNTTNGPIPSSLDKDFFAQCKFVINYENQTYPGYNTEKLAQGYINGAIPIYYSHPIGLREINKDAIIFAGDFESEDTLVEYVKKLDNDNDLYCKKYNKHLIIDEQKNYSVLKEKLKERIKKILETTQEK